MKLLRLFLLCLAVSLRAQTNLPTGEAFLGADPLAAFALSGATGGAGVCLVEVYDASA
ncbi:MAG: hypothetical protein HZA31_12830 [Opitutae bacterium]|nr:hypothetical protein [Opitutae bacterium]